MDRLVDHLFVFEGAGEVRDFPGNYTQYRIWLKDNEKKENKWDALQDRKSKGESTETAVASLQSSVGSGQPAAAKKKMSFKEKREFEMLEKEMPELEKEKQSITDTMGTGNLSFEELQKLSERIIVIDQLLGEKELRWLELSEMTQ